jgi:hypothetical protein
VTTISPDGSENIGPMSSVGPLDTALISADAKSKYRVLRVSDFVVTVAIVSALVLLPVVAESAASVKCAESFGGGWAWLLLTLPIATILYNASAVGRFP